MGTHRTTLRLVAAAMILVFSTGFEWGDLFKKDKTEAMQEKEREERAAEEQRRAREEAQRKEQMAANLAYTRESFALGSSTDQMLGQLQDEIAAWDRDFAHVDSLQRRLEVTDYGTASKIRTLINKNRPNEKNTQRLRDELRELGSPFEQALTDGTAETSPPDEKLARRIRGIHEDVAAALTAYKRDRDELQAILAAVERNRTSKGGTASQPPEPPPPPNPSEVIPQPGPNPPLRDVLGHWEGKARQTASGVNKGNTTWVVLKLDASGGTYSASRQRGCPAKLRIDANGWQKRPQSVLYTVTSTTPGMNPCSNSMRITVEPVDDNTVEYHHYGPAGGEHGDASVVTGRLTRKRW